MSSGGAEEACMEASLVVSSAANSLPPPTLGLRILAAWQITSAARQKAARDLRQAARKFGQAARKVDF